MCGKDRQSLVCEGSVDVFVCVLQHMCRIMCWYDKERVRNSDGIKGEALLFHIVVRTKHGHISDCMHVHAHLQM